MKNITRYGIDAPPVILKLFLAGLLCIAAACIINYFNFTGAHILVIVASIFATINILFPMLMLWSSIFGKKILRNKIISLASLSGNERILDIGCGRGLLLIGFAQKISENNKVEGLDLWRSQDLSNNTMTQLEQNALAEGVQNKINLSNNDMTNMPYADETFDLIVSNLAIHNLSDKKDREKTLNEINRVLKPGGRILLSDFCHLTDYKTFFQKIGWQSTKLSRYYCYTFPPVRILMSTKPINHLK